MEVGDGRRFVEEEGLTKIARIRDVGEGISVAVRRVGGGALLGGASEGVTSALLRSLAIEDGSAGFGRCLGLGVGSCLCLGIGGGGRCGRGGWCPSHRSAAGAGVRGGTCVAGRARGRSR